MDLEAIKKIPLQCPGEDTLYLPPDNLLTPDGKRRFAYVVLIMMGDKYVVLAVLLAYSLRRAGTGVDLIVQVTEDVSEKARQVLKEHFDHVIEVPYIYVKSWRGEQQKHRKYLHYVFTKFQAFQLTQYDKVVLLDADALMLSHTDHIFTLEPPAGIYIKYKELYVYYDNDGQYKLPPNGKIDWFEKYCDCCMHGKKIPKAETDDVVTNPKNSGIGAGLMLIKPSNEEYDKMMADIRGPNYELISRKFIWPEQQYLTYWYSGKWTSMNPKFFGLQGYPHWSVLFGTHYAGDKPFMANYKTPIEERIKYSDFVLWHKMFQELLTEHPEYSDVEFMQEAIDMNHKVMSSGIREISRQMSTSVPRDDMAISHALGISCLNQEYRDVYYYNKSCDFIDWDYEEPLFAGVHRDDFVTPIHNLARQFPGSYYNKLSQKIGIKRGGIAKLDLSESENDEVVLQYVNSHPSVRILAFWGIDPWTQVVDGDYEILHQKTITVDGNGLQRLIYTLKGYQTRTSRVPYKENFKNVILHIVLLDVKPGGTLKLNSTLGLLSRNFDETILYAQTFFHEGTTQAMIKSDISRKAKGFFDTSHVRINSIKSYAYHEMTPMERFNLLLSGDITMDALGIRPANKLAINWNTEFMNRVVDTNGPAPSLDPSEYFYYHGLKVPTLDNYIMAQDMAKQYGDLIMMSIKFRHIVGDKIQLNSQNQLVTISVKPDGTRKREKRINTHFKEPAKELFFIKKNYTADDTKDVTLNVVKSILT